ncbi:hypothetical protein [Mesobacterium pallidum]|uniref:RipA family octameric membrane protein n=1 Tax=Mesobacterium pallidum TaxID=2872037 RepID=UPI001EE392CB|nr:hypothetical protein [Mesobacterium pallidum]
MDDLEKIELYRKKLGFPEASDKDRRERAFDLAHQLRQFEIELTWKRSTYFWGLQIAAFVAYATIFRSVDFAEPPITRGAEVLQSKSTFGAFLLLITSLFGLASSVILSKSIKSSKQWQYNWEKHIDFLEHEFSGDLYKTVYRREKDFEVSLTGLNLASSSVAALTWCAILILSICVLHAVRAPFSSVDLVAGLLIFFVIAIIFDRLSSSTESRLSEISQPLDILESEADFTKRRLDPMK